MNDFETASAVCNLALVRGGVVSAPTMRDLPSGGVAVQFDVSTVVANRDRHATVSVPVAWIDPTPGDLACVQQGAEIMVVGTVRRRFFRVGGATQSRTEVVADTVIPTRRRKQVAAALQSIVGGLASR